MRSTFVLGLVVATTLLVAGGMVPAAEAFGTGPFRPEAYSEGEPAAQSCLLRLYLP